MNYNKLTKAELVKALISLKSIGKDALSGDAQQRLLHELQVHQIELEMLNRELQETQRKLEASRDRYAALYDFAPISYVTLDKNGVILEINLTGAAMLGPERLHLLGKPFTNWVAKSDAQKLRNHLQSCKHAHENVTTELHLVAENDKLIEVQLSSLAVQDPEWLTAVYRTVIVDITERKRAEAALRESEERFRLMADDAPVMIWESGVDALCRYFNKPWLNFTGRTMEQELGNGWAKGVHADDLQRCLDIYQSSFNARRPFEMEYRLRRFDGEYRWVLDRGAPRFTPNGGFAGYIGSCIDITERKRTEEALRVTQEHLQIVTEAMAAPVTHCSRDLTYLWANKSCAELLNRSVDQIIGRPIVEIIGQQSFNELLPYYQRVLSGEKVRIEQEVEYQGLGRRWVNVSYTPTLDAAGVPDGWVAVVVDVTGRKQAEEEVRKLNAGLEARVLERTAQLDATVRSLQSEIAQRERAEKKFQNLLEFAPDAMIIADKNGEIMLMNAQAEKLFGYSQQELLGRNLTMLMPDRFRERHRQRQAHYFANSQTRPMGVGLELYGLRRDGREFPVEISLGPLDTEEGIVITAVIRDITERKQAEEERAKLAAIVESSYDGVVGASVDGAIVSWNHGAGKIFGYNSDEAIGRPIYILSPPDRREEAAQLVAMLKQGERIEQFETIRLRKDGTPINVSLTLSPIKNQAGQITGIAAIVRDITERKRAEEQIQFLYFTTQAINQAAGFHEALAIALREICTLTGWEYGEAWISSVDGTRLECSPAWFGDRHLMSGLRKRSEELSFKANEGLPGRVWASNRMEWMNDLASQPAHIFRRAPLTQELGLKTAIGVPILVDGKVLAVLLFFSTSARAQDQSLMALFSTMAGQLGATLRRKQAEQELIDSREQLRNLSAYLQAAREEERARIAREIHDELGQTLTALKMDLSWLGKRLPENGELLHEKTVVMTDLVDTTIKTVQRISAELRPGLLDNLGLAEAIEWQAREFRDRTGIECEMKCTLDSVVIDRERSTAIFRIVQEALTNVARHAEATKIVIDMRQKAHTLLLKVRDNGKGITREEVFNTNSFGLVGMRERVHPWGGKVKIKGVPGKGTVVFVNLPVNNTSPYFSASNVT